MHDDMKTRQLKKPPSSSANSAKKMLNLVFRVLFFAVACFYTVQCVIKYLDFEVGTR